MKEGVILARMRILLTLALAMAVDGVLFPESPREHAPAFCHPVALRPSYGDRGQVLVNRHKDGLLPVGTFSLELRRHPARLSGVPCSIVMQSEIEVRGAPLYYGGVGRFLRSPDVLEIMMEQASDDIAEDLRPNLDETLTKIKPMEDEVTELRRKYEETENEVFGCQILPLEVKMRPYEARIKQQRAILKEREEELAALTALRDSARGKFKAEGVVDVVYAGFGERVFPCMMQRSAGLGKAQGEEVEVTVSGGGDTYDVQAAWKTNMASQPFLVESNTDASGDTSGLVVSMATPDEGPARLCVVMEWFGDTKGDEVEEKKRQLLKWLKADRVTTVDPGATHVAVFSDPVPMKRRNEMWVEIVPPQGADWYDVASRIATDRPAKNSTLYQIKDCPWAAVQAWADDEGFAKADGEARGIKPTWSVTSFLQDNKFKASFPAGDGMRFAVDKSSTGELAISLVRPPNGKEEIEKDAMVPYAVTSVQGWPITSAAVEAARKSLLEGIEGDEAEPLDSTGGSFRILVQSPGNVEMWIRLKGDV